MKSFSLIALCSLVVNSLFSQSPGEISLVPQPVSIEKINGQFQLGSSTAIIAVDNNEEVQKVIRFFYRRRQEIYGISISRSIFQKQPFIYNLF